MSTRKRRFDALFASYGSDIVAYCGWRSASRSDAQDAAADVFLTAWRRLDEVPEGDAAKVWLYATARRVLANQRRSTRRREALHERLAAEEATRPAEQQSSEEALVHEALRLLPAVDREVLLLAEWEGLSPAEIAAVLGCRRVTARGVYTARGAGSGRPSMSCGRDSDIPRTSRFRKGGSMSTSESLEALRRANPRSTAGFAQSVDAVRAQIAITEAAPRQPALRRRVGTVRLAAIGAALTVAVGVAAVTVRSPGGGPGVEDAAAVVSKAATVTAAAAERSGTAVVLITHDGELWAGSTIDWHGDDLSVRSNAPDRAGKVGRRLLVVGGTVYGRDPRTGEWWAQGSPGNIDPDSGTTPVEYLAAVREDVGGVTLSRLARSVTGFSTSRGGGGSTVYRGKVPAGAVARETGFKEGQAIRVFPFGYVAHDEAADPDSLLGAALTVGTDGVLREIALSWGNWTYVVTYSGLGSTPALVAPKNARDLVKERLRAVGRG